MAAILVCVLQLLLLLLLLLLPIGNAQDQCSRSRSRTARRILEEYLQPFVEIEKYELQPECRLHPVNDVFREQDLEREYFHVNQWRCGYCEKLFESESYLDLHMDNRHSDLLNVTRQNCLADLCGALHCDYMETKEKHKFSGGNKCGPGVERNRHLCEKLANTCFPPQQSAAALRLNDFFLRQFCDAHSCKPRRKYFPRGSGLSNDSVYYAACFFAILIVLLFYGGLYIYKRDTQISISSLKRLSRRTSVKATKAH